MEYDYNQTSGARAPRVPIAGSYSSAAPVPVTEYRFWKLYADFVKSLPHWLVDGHWKG
jgi:hypothetical protein